MDEYYQSYRIHVAARHLSDSNAWEPLVTINWTEPNSEIRFATPNFKRTFSTQAEAESEALLLTKKWIDDGKPPLPA